MERIRTRRAARGDLAAVKRLAEIERKTIGFVNRAIFLSSMEAGELVVAFRGPRVVGFLRWHRRLDGWSTVYEICVDRGSRGSGAGRMLIASIPSPIRLKCPIDNPSNGFYARLGFVLQEVLPGKRRPLNLWTRDR